MPAPDSKNKALHLLIAGRVQGVGYRRWFEAQAVKARLSGWVRNLSDGRVEAVIAGPGEAVDTLASAARHGPPLARVDSVSAEKAEYENTPGFQVKETF